MEIKDKDAQIKELFENGLGARHIAARLGIIHHVSVSKRLRRMCLKRGHCVEDPGRSILNFESVQDKLGAAAECYAKYLFISCGYNVLIPEPGSAYDLIVEIDGRFQKIQVKSSYCKNESGNYCFNLRRTRNNSTGHRRVNYSNNECDYFFLFDAIGNKWLIPFDKLSNTKSGVVPALRYPGYKIHDPWHEIHDSITESATASSCEISLP